MPNDPNTDAAKGLVTRLLVDWRKGDGDARDRLITMVYDELHRLAQSYMRGERDDHTLQPTSLVHEAYLRLVDSEVSIKNRVHFFALAATVMRRVLIDHARSRGRAKRGGQLVTLESGMIGDTDTPLDVLVLNEALDKLGAQDQRKKQVVELIYFGGLTYAEAAQVLEISPATIDRDLRMAKAWLTKEMGVG